MEAGQGLRLRYPFSMAPMRYAAFVSYAHRYREWVAVLQGHLEQGLAAAGRPEPESRVFLDQVDLGSGRSWVGQLQAGLAQSDHLVLVATPEALASPRVGDEWESFVTIRRDWQQGHLHIVRLVDTPLPPFLDLVQHVDFTRHGERSYRRALQELLAGLLGHSDRRQLPALPADLQIPDPPEERLPSSLRGKLVDWLAPALERQMPRRVVASALGLERTALDAYPSWRCAASAALVKATGDDDPVAAALRVADILTEELAEEEPARLAGLKSLREALDGLRREEPDRGLLQSWLQRVAAAHGKLVPYFQQRAELDLLDRVYVALELRPEVREGRFREAGGAILGRPLGLRELLALDRAEHPWITHRWVVRGDPGAGKTTLLRHLAASLAGEPAPRWVPVFESLPRLLREHEWLLDRIARQMGRAGHAARGLPAVLDRAGREGRLLLLLDGLDEVPREDHDEAEGLLRELSARWPDSPLVVTTRPIGYRRPDNDFFELELLPLDRHRRREFLARWFGRASGTPDPARAARALAVLEDDPGVRELAGNPLYLTLMALLLEEEIPLDRSRTRLYDQVFLLLLEGKHRPEGQPMECQDAVRRVLRHLGHAMTMDSRDAEPVTALEARLYQAEVDPLRAPLERVPRWKKHGLRLFLDELAERTGILGPHDGPDADWRFWHRTFREALAAEHLEQVYKSGGQAAILAHARTITQDEDESRWAEPYALLAGRVDGPDALVRALVKENRTLGLRALATAQGLGDATLTEILALSKKWEERAEVYRRLPGLVGDPARALALLDRLRRRTRNGNDLYFLDLAVREVGRRWPDHTRLAADLCARLYDHIPAPPVKQFQGVETPHAGRVPLWPEIPAGRFWMGSPKGEGVGDERPRHVVTIVRAFRLGAVPVTNVQYAAFDPEHEPVPWPGVSLDELPYHPVVNITWYEAVSYCRWLSASADWARGARLPTEEEWEYACRAETETCYWSGNREEHLAQVGWYAANSDGRTHRVGAKPANGWGLYDVHGNVWEWTLSLYTEHYAGRQGGITHDPAVVALEEAKPEAPSGGRRVIRGGCCWVEAAGARAAYRYVGDPRFKDDVLGFRVVLPVATEAVKTRRRMPSTEPP